MRSPGTGEAGFAVLRGAPNAAAYALELVIVAAGYVGLAATELLLPSLNPTATPLWPPTGFALALILLSGFRIWPAIVLGSFSFGVIASHTFLVPAFSAAGTLCAAAAGAWLINRWSNGRKTFETPAGAAKFALIVFAPSAMIGAAIATGGAILAEDVDFANSANWITTLATWWLADAAGGLILAPVVVLWAMTPLRPLTRQSLLETAAIFVLATGIGFLAFGPPVDDALEAVQPYRSLFGFLILIPLMWAGLRGNRRDAATAALIFCGIAAWGLPTGDNPSLQTDLSGSPLWLLAISVGASLPPLMLCAAIATRQDTEARLLRAQEQLNRQLAQTNFALESSRRHFQILIEGIVDYAIFVLDTAGRVASWNKAAEQIIGYTSDEIIGKHFGIFYRPDERRAGEPNRALDWAVQKGKHDVEGWRIKKNGTLFFVTGSVTSIHDNSGNLIGFANVIRDATERRNTQEKLVQAREQLAMAQKMEAIGKLTGGIAHDFNNLLDDYRRQRANVQTPARPEIAARDRGDPDGGETRRKPDAPIIDVCPPPASQPDRDRSERLHQQHAHDDRKLVARQHRLRGKERPERLAGKGRPCRAGARHRQYRRQRPRRHAKRRHVRHLHPQCGGRARRR